MYSPPSDLVVVQIQDTMNLIVYSSSGVQLRQISIVPPARTNFQIWTQKVGAVAVDAVSGDLFVTG